MDWNDSSWWLALGLLGQTAFASRFLVQWLASEIAGESKVPKAFWYLSIVGSLALLVYAIHRREPVFAVGFLPNTLVYVRNLVLVYRNERRDEAMAELAGGTAGEGAEARG